MLPSTLGFPFARYEVVRIVNRDNARALLKRVLDQQLVTTAATWDPQSKPGATLNVFFSWTGLASLAINASIRYQQFLQTEWINNGEFAGLSKKDVDPFVGEPRERSRYRITDADGPPKDIFDLPAFVTLRGGGYYFIPSIRAMRFIGGQAV